MCGNQNRKLETEVERNPFLTLVRPGKMAVSAGRGIAREGTCKATIAVFMVEAAVAHPSPIFRMPGANLAAVVFGKDQSL